MNFAQLQAILWLRWRLTRNQFARAGKINAVLAVALLVLAAMGAMGAGIGGFALGLLAGAKAPPLVMLLVWDGIVFFFMIVWLSGVLVELQRSESIDMDRLLHLPVTLRQVFVLNYIASHFAPSLVLFLPAALGFCAGVTLTAGLRMSLMIPLVLSFVFLVTAWTYCLRGWLSAVMVNKRRRRAILMYVTIALILFGQLPNLIFNSPYFRQRARNKSQSTQTDQKRRSAPEQVELPAAAIEGHLAVPPGWPGYAAMSLEEHQLLPALTATAACFLIGVVGLSRAYKLTMRYYTGADTTAPVKIARPAAAHASAAGGKGRMLVEYELPGLAEDTGALALATFRSLLRAPEVKMAAVMPLVLGIVFFSIRFHRPVHAVPPIAALFAATGACALAAFSLGPTMANSFGLDRNGFRALVLLPARRQDILLAKNLAFYPFFTLLFVLLLGLLKWLLGMSWMTLLISVLQAQAAYLLVCISSNLTSILLPYRLAPGTLKAKKPRPLVILGLILFAPAFSITLAPVFIPAGLQALSIALGWAPWLPVNLLVTLILVPLVGWVYWLVLPMLGSLLQRRELTILREVTEEIE
jgi:hypothetical protein